jgi:hypothetical protein
MRYRLHTHVEPPPRVEYAIPQQLQLPAVLAVPAQLGVGLVAVLAHRPERFAPSQVIAAGTLSVVLIPCRRVVTISVEQSRCPANAPSRRRVVLRCAAGVFCECGGWALGGAHEELLDCVVAQVYL